MDNALAGDTSVAVEDATGPDYDTLSNRVGEQLFDQTGPREIPDEPDEETPAPEPDLPEAAPSPTRTPESDVPKSWPKDMHPHWATMPPEARAYWQTRETQMLTGLDQYKQEAAYGKSLREVLAPYEQIFHGKGLDAPRAVADMMGAYTALTQGTMESRHAAYAKMGQHLGLAQTAQQGEALPPLDPRLQSMQAQFEQMQQALTAQQTEAMTAARARASQEVEKFAADPANIYFNDVQDDILNELKAGYDLPTAYKRAVRANDVTFQKEIARSQTETEAKLKENARLQALPKKQAKSINIGGRESQSGPTETLGSLEDTIRSARTRMIARA